MDHLLIEEDTQCPECLSAHLIRDYGRGELTCNACGLVVDDHFFDPGPEWRAYDHQQMEEKAHTGAPLNIMSYDKGLSTNIGSGNRDFFGVLVPQKNRAQLHRLRRCQQRSRLYDSDIRNMAKAFQEMSRLSSNLGFQRTIRESAAAIYRKALASNLIKGRSIEALVAASLYAACRQNSSPRTMDEIARHSQVTKKQVGRMYRLMHRELRFNHPPLESTAYISRYCNDLKLNSEVEFMAREIIDNAMAKELTSGRGPTGIAAAAIYQASIQCGQPRTQKEVAEAAMVTEVTIRNRYKEFIGSMPTDQGELL